MRIVRRLFQSKSWGESLKAGRRALETGRLELAEEELQRAHQLARKMFSKRDPRRLESLEAWARLRQARWDPDGSRLQAEAYRLRLRNHGSHHVATAAALVALVGDDAWGEVTQPELIDKAYGLAQSLERNSHRFANILGKLALQKPAESREMLESAEQICARIHGRQVDTTMPPVARSLADIALAHRHHDLALAFLRHALRLCELKFRSRSQEVADVLHQLGQVAMLMSDFERAEKYLRKARDLSSNFELAASLGGCLHAQGHLAEAEDCYRVYLSHAETAYGFTSPQVAHALHCLMTLLEGSGRSAEAETVLERLLSVVPRAPRALKLEIAERLRLFGFCAARGEGYLRHALAIRQKVLGSRHPLTAQLQRDLSDLLGEGREAKKLAKVSSRRLKRVKGEPAEQVTNSDRRLVHQLRFWVELARRSGDNESLQRLNQRSALL